MVANTTKNMPKKSNPPKPRASDQVENELRRLILTLELEPGLAVSESTLMKRYGWGRTPLREAFQRLSEQGLLQTIPQHGVVVTPLNLFDFDGRHEPGDWLRCLTGLQTTDGSRARST